MRLRTLAGLGAVLVVAALVAGSSYRASADPRAGATALANVAAAQPKNWPSTPSSSPSVASSSAATSSAVSPSASPAAVPSAGPSRVAGGSSSQPAGGASAAAPYPVTDAEPLPVCTIDDVATPRPNLSDWALTLVDTTYDVPSTYAPEDLVSTGEAGLSSSYQVRSVMVPDLRALAAAAAAAGGRLGIDSAYRDYSTQIGTFWYWSGVLGYGTALQSSARPGHSEHQLGLAIDFKESGGPEPWTYYNFAIDTRAGQWLAANAWKYGFLMSYPLGTQAKTCYGFEPWHYRYVGVAEAAAIHASGLTTREWMWSRQPNPEPPSPMPLPSPSPVPVGPPGDLPAPTAEPSGPIAG